MCLLTTVYLTYGRSSNWNLVRLEGDLVDKGGTLQYPVIVLLVSVAIWYVSNYL